ncbi:hypothetical protein BJ138DRAFT_1115465 [Hygrophoropsis aurantiaca]|uniref:Uncharacterized protein n=1 Tax=Hygrophoropsis aurantiaca TaxID=72124 RepID=A0ACB8A848_9AGAM|nr:hypothetical protein BJ138DRAFT_1115465 [Hygrophoropsis aurantiaca]
MNPLTCNAWRSGDLTKAEEALSEVIKANMNDHNAFTNRALIRAHEVQRDRALEDAQMSINILPSVLGYVALSIALTGQGRSEHAMQAFDLGFVVCKDDVNIIRFLLLIKSIIIFNYGRRDEGIERITDLIKAHPGNDNFLCYSVQAYMYVQLGMAAMKQQKYDRVVQLLTCALALGPFGTRIPELQTISLIFGWKFDTLWRDIHQQKCEALYATGRTNEAAEALHVMINQLDYLTRAMKETDDWLTDFEHRCAQKSVTLGDEALRVGRYNGAVNQYSAALAFGQSKEDVLIKRSKARAAMGIWKDALKDAEHATKLNPLSPWGFERMHAALHGAQDFGNAIEAFNTMLLKLESSPDPLIRQLRKQYVSPSDTEYAIQRAIDKFLQNYPLRLIETTTGHLYGHHERINTFKATPNFKELISSMTTDAKFDYRRITEVVKRYFQYAMLSHRWEGKEPLLGDVQNKSVYDLESLYPVTKLQRFCEIARHAGYNWAWSDTCCIDKTNSVELQQSLNSMFTWYHNSLLTVVYLSDVPPSSKLGALGKSAWNTRGWTLQEFLAPNVILFFVQDWTPYLNDFSSNHKTSTAIMQELEDATGIAAQALVDFRPGTKEVRQKLQWASTRVTTVQEDVAYSLLGIFDVKLPVIYGENKQHALGRLLQEIVARSGDISALDWSGQSSEYNSCLPADISAYEAPACVPPSESQDQSSVPADLALELYNKLDNQPPPRFANHRLTLPCIVFPVTELTKRTDGRFNVYSAIAEGLEDVQIIMEDSFKLFTFSVFRPDHMGREILLVRPWNRDLLGVVHLASDVRHAVAAPPPSNDIPLIPSSHLIRMHFKRKHSSLLLISNNDLLHCCYCDSVVENTKESHPTAISLHKYETSTN